MSQRMDPEEEEESFGEQMLSCRTSKTQRDINKCE